MNIKSFKSGEKNMLFFLANSTFSGCWIKGYVSNLSLKHFQTLLQWICDLDVKYTDSVSKVSNIDTPAWATVSTVRVTVAHDSQVTLVLSQASDNQCNCTMTPIEDYKDSLSCWQPPYYIDFVILVIAVYIFFCLRALLTFCLHISFIFFRDCRSHFCWYSMLDTDVLPLISNSGVFLFILKLSVWCGFL